MSCFDFLLSGQDSDKVVLYFNARVVDPYSKSDFFGYVLTRGGLIEKIGVDYKGIKYDESVDCQTKLLIPGVIDIHVHLREPGQEKKETIETGTKSAAAGGVTTVVCQPNTEPKISNLEVVECIQKIAKERAYVNVLMYATITKDGNLVNDILELYKSGVVGFTDDGLPVMNSLAMRDAFVLASELNVPIAQHAEDLYLSNDGCINEGDVSKKLNVKGIPEESESAMVARDLVLMANTKAKYHVLHVSSKQTVDLVRKAKNIGRNVTCEVTPHHFTLNDSAILDFKSLAKINPPLRDEYSRLSLVDGLKDGTIDVIASDHAPHEDETKNKSIEESPFGMIGLETILPLSLELYHNGTMDLYSVLAKLTCNPADVINIKSGRIEKGFSADLVILDLDKEYEIDVQKFSSKSKNSPFNGRKVRGKVIRTVVKGKTVYKEV
ncbi:dihydroorotase [Anaplasmataceae bacterium AB001_6]|nr:dihydroorotase [Anaplasmataceae bacterium AB001_6]